MHSRRQIFVRSPYSKQAVALQLDPAQSELTLPGLTSLLESSHRKSLSDICVVLDGKPLNGSTRIQVSELPSVSMVTLYPRFRGGGGDGAESRDCYLNMYAEKKPDKVDPNEQRLSNEPLAEPCVIDLLGNLFNKEALVHALLTKSQSVEGGGFQDLESLVRELVNCLNSLSENVASNANDELENNVFQVLVEILQSLSIPKMDQAVIDALSFELPKVISKFANQSSRCLQLVEEIIDRFVEACNPRDMLSILCEALDAARCSVSSSSCSTPLLHGLSKVFTSVQRRHYQQLKVAVPIVLNVLKDISLETDVQVEGLFDKALGIAVSIRDVSSKLKSEEDIKVRCLLGLYVIQITAILSVSIRDKLDSCVPLVMQLEPFLTYCGLTHLGLITGNDTEKLMSTVAEDDNDFVSSFPDINLGASLLLIWAKISSEAAEVTYTTLGNDVKELQSNQVKRWQAYGMLKYILSSGDLLWDFKRHVMEFLLDITKEVTSSQCNDEQIDCSDDTPSIYAALQAVTLVIMYAPDTCLRRKTFEALKRILSDIPASQRFEVLRALVTNSQSPSMTAILLGLVKDSMGKSSLQATDSATADTHVIELVELVLRPPQGGPPLLPDQSDAVLAALNLYRFALLFKSRESAGKERSTGDSEILSKKNLEKAYKEWLLPLRTVVSCSISENLKDNHGHESSPDAVCLLNPIELVLYRCIELVEEKLKSHS